MNNKLFILLSFKIIIYQKKKKKKKKKKKNKIIITIINFIINLRLSIKTFTIISHHRFFSS